MWFLGGEERGRGRTVGIRRAARRSCLGQVADGDHVGAGGRVASGADAGGEVALVRGCPARWEACRAAGRGAELVVDAGLLGGGAYGAQ